MLDVSSVRGGEETLMATEAENKVCRLFERGVQRFMYTWDGL